MLDPSRLVTSAKLPCRPYWVMVGLSLVFYSDWTWSSRKGLHASQPLYHPIIRTISKELTIKPSLCWEVNRKWNQSDSRRKERRKHSHSINSSPPSLLILNPKPNEMKTNFSCRSPQPSEASDWVLCKVNRKRTRDDWIPRVSTQP